MICLAAQMATNISAQALMCQRGGDAVCAVEVYWPLRSLHSVTDMADDEQSVAKETLEGGICNAQK